MPIIVCRANALAWPSDEDALLDTFEPCLTGGLLSSSLFAELGVKGEDRATT